MHVGRVHLRNIAPPNTGQALIIERAPPHKHPRSHLTDDEVTTLLVYLNAHRDEYTNKTSCFRAALEATHLAGRIQASSTAITRYFDKADALKNGGIAAEPAKRKYTKRQVKPVAQEIRVNFCPQCGCNIHAVATGMAMAKLV